MIADAITECRSCPLEQRSGQRCPFLCTPVKPETILCAQGDTPDRVFFIKSGLVALSRISADGEEREVALRGPGSMVCYEALLRRPSSQEVRVVGDATVCAIPAERMETWIGAGPSPSKAVTELLIGELLQRTDDMRQTRGDALGRVARFLADSGTVCEGPKPLQKRVVAHALGMRPETLSRCLSQLQKKGLVEGRRYIRVLDVEALRSMAAVRQ